MASPSSFYVIVPQAANDRQAALTQHRPYTRLDFSHEGSPVPGSPGGVTRPDPGREAPGRSEGSGLVMVEPKAAKRVLLTLDRAPTRGAVHLQRRFVS